MAMRQSFEEWMRAVDAEIERRVHLSASDIDDWRYRDDYDEGLTPKRSAARAIANAKEAMGL